MNEWMNESIKVTLIHLHCKSLITEMEDCIKQCSRQTALVNLVFFWTFSQWQQSCDNQLISLLSLCKNVAFYSTVYFLMKYFALLSLHFDFNKKNYSSIGRCSLQHGLWTLQLSPLSLSWRRNWKNKSKQKYWYEGLKFRVQKSDVAVNVEYYGCVCVELGRMAVPWRRYCGSNSKHECLKCYVSVRVRSPRPRNGNIPCSDAPVEFGIWKYERVAKIMTLRCMYRRNIEANWRNVFLPGKQ
jgi:hypothetical protein